MSSLREFLRLSLRPWRVAFLAAGLACAGSTAPPESVPATPRAVDREPSLRVALRPRVTEVIVGAQGEVEVTASGRTLYRMTEGSSITLIAAGSGIEVAGGDGGAFPQLEFKSRDRSRFITVGGLPYRGSVVAQYRDGAATVINVVTMEDYLLGVVPVEMGKRRSDELAALEAQAVASRTYALHNRGKFDGSGYDIRASVSDQAYGGVSRETPDAAKAVANTRGEVLTYNSLPIAAFFHSTCGEGTASPDEVFRTVTPVAYLRPVSDEDGSGYYGDISPHFRWTVTWEGSDLERILRQTVPRVLGIDASEIDMVRDVYVRSLGASGRATEVRIVVSSGEIPVFGPDVRSVFARPDGRPLASNAVRFTAERQEGRVRRLAAEGMGFGHGVGLCQWGAIGRARAGQDYKRILTTYYPGARVERWY